MVRIAKQPDPKRIHALKQQIQDEDYLDAAIQRLAHKLTEELVERRRGNPSAPKPTEGTGTT
jgi:hypothetical protein